MTVEEGKADSRRFYMKRTWRVWNERAIWLVVLFLCCLGQDLLALDPAPTNGVAYILLPKEIPAKMDGVYRLNSYSDPFGPIALGKRIFDLQFSVATTVNGLAVDQENRLYLFISPSISGDYTLVDKQGWLPKSAFEPDSPAFIKLIGQPFNSTQISRDITGPMPNRQYDHGTTNYDGDFWDYGPYPASPHYPSGWPHTHAAYTKGSFVDASGNPYQYQFNPINPASHKGIPLWNGPGGSSAGIKHLTDPYKVILPNKWGGISWFAYPTKNIPPSAPEAAYNGLLDGKDGRPEVTQYDFRLKHDDVADGFRRLSGSIYVPMMSPYWDAWYISAVVKRVYWTRDRSLDLYSYKDVIIPPDGPPYSNKPGLDAAKVLSATDLDIKEEYGKTCGDGCIPGGPMNPQAVGKVESVVQVFTSTTGRRYGFNPYGNDMGPYGENDAALRVVSGGTTYNLDLSATNIRNQDYLLTTLGYAKLKDISRMGVSSNFDPAAIPVVSAPDYLFGSVAEKFVMQDSWWGLGGVGFEYFGQDISTPNGKLFKKGHIYRLDYLDSLNPNAEDVGLFDGSVDAIGVDGEGNLYVLFTELDCPNDPIWPDPAGMPKGPVLAAQWPSSDITGHSEFLGNGSWMRPGIGTGDVPISDPTQAGDYLDLYFRQKIYKVARKYTANAGGGYNLSSVEERGKVEAGYDKISRKLRYDGGALFSWANDWYHSENVVGRVASVKAEFAVVNIAARPTMYHGPTDCTYSVCRDDPGLAGKRTNNSVPIFENDVVTFKLEGYKPFGANGERQHFRGVGNIPGLGITTVNMIPPYENYDEDSNSVAGGFPSSMFESETLKTQIYWFVDLLDSTDPASGKVLKHFLVGDGGSPNGGGDNQTFFFKFPQPGNYAVYAKFKYNYFDYSKLADLDNPRPSDLKLVATTYPLGAGVFETTQKVLYAVESAPAINPDKYVTNVHIYKTGLQDVSSISGGGDTYDLPENASPTALSFSFEAQFVRDANRNASDADFKTFNGVGVWDYGDSEHVYNYGGPNLPIQAFNPGFVKEYDTAELAKHGTMVEGSLSPKDLAAFKWRLYIYPTYDGAAFPLDGPGVPYGVGDCSTASGSDIEDLGGRKFRIKVNINKTDLAPIKTPIDPGQYRVRLELVYPRVTWFEYKTGPGATQFQYRSIIPDPLPNGIVTTVKGTDDPLNPVSWDLDNALFDNGDSWNIRARDFEVGVASISTSPNPIIQSTSDPVETVTITAGLSDNNPNAVFPPESGTPLQIWYQFPKYKRHRTEMKEAYVASTRTGDPGPMPLLNSFYENDWLVSASYTAQIADLNAFNPDDGDFKNWVGKIDFAVDAELKDGYGASIPLNLATPHHFYATAPADEFPMSISTSKVGLQRYDNDPPSLRCIIVSQADNRRWEIVLQEADRDLVCNPKTDGQLGKCQLSVAAYQLSENKTIGSLTVLITGTAKGIGSASGTVTLDETNPEMTADVLALLPVVRRSTRILANFSFWDNVDYLNFSSAEFKISDKFGQSLITGAAPAVPLASRYLESTNNQENSNHPGTVSNPEPQARFSADTPMKVDPIQTKPSEYQINIRCLAADAEGNTRSLVIPVKVIDSSFETRVLESREERR